ncbi:MAG: DUF1570 domain-containing protein [Planctomycetota bacterium]
MIDPWFLPRKRRANSPLLIRLTAVLLTACCGVVSAAGADRFFAVVPPSQRSDAADSQNRLERPFINAGLRFGTEPSLSSDGIKKSDDWKVAGWDQYLRLWKEFAENPSDRTLRQYLGLPLESKSGSLVLKISRGRSAPRWLGWRPGTYAQVDTPHLQIFSHASREETLNVAEDLERVYWVWTQMFYPLWDTKNQVALHLSKLSSDKSISEQLAAKPTRLRPRRKLRIVLLRDLDDYVATLGSSIPGIEQSTGFYADERRTSFFFPSDNEDAAASRRHELVHQLFRECTLSQLGDQMPGEQQGFWLIEGIAGYFESLWMGEAMATVGGWDSPRLQYARHRVFRRRQVVALDELKQDSRAAAQTRGDLATFYAFSIAYTHAMLDGPDQSARRWVMRKLADLYRVRLDLEPPEPTENIEQYLIDFLRVDDVVVRENPPQRELSELCLAGCSVTPDALELVPPSSRFRWLDLTGLTVQRSDLERLLSSMDNLEQVSLESSRVGPGIGNWLTFSANLVELDLSETACDDSDVASLRSLQKLKTLWLTGTNVTDASIASLAELNSLQFLDVQKTAISKDGLRTLRAKFPRIKINGQ